jgi:hypothetical protein
MLEPKSVEIDGLEFQINKMPLMESRVLDLKVLRLLAPLVGALDAIKSASSDGKPALSLEPSEAEFDPESIGQSEPSSDPEAEDNVEWSKVGACFQKALTALPDAEFTGLCRAMLARVVCIPPGEAPILLTSDKAIDAAFAFADSPIAALYKALFEVARFNKFTPFALFAGGHSIGAILGSFGLSKGKAKGVKLDRLVRSTD